MLRPTVTQGIGEGNANKTTHFFTGEESRASPVDTTHDVKVEEFTLEAFLAQRRFEMRSQEM